MCGTGARLSRSAQYHIRNGNLALMTLKVCFCRKLFSHARLREIVSKNGQKEYFSTLLLSLEYIQSLVTAQSLSTGIKDNVWMYIYIFSQNQNTERNEPGFNALGFLYSE